MSLIDDMMAHASESYPDEACGLVVAHGKHCRVLRAKNIAHDPRVHFDLDPDAWLEVGDHEAVIGVYHSHPSGIAQPSLADRSSCEASGLPWHIVGYETGDYVRIEPTGFEAPLLQRPYVYGVHDCWSLVRDWCRQELGLSLKDFHREPLWWEKGQNLFLENAQACGFVAVDGQDFQKGDVVLIQVQSPVPNHIAVWLGDGTIMHHVQGRLSSRDPWAGFWVRHMTHHFRHKSRIGMTDG